MCFGEYIPSEKKKAVIAAYDAICPMLEQALRDEAARDKQEKEQERAEVVKQASKRTIYDMGDDDTQIKEGTKEPVAKKLKFGDDAAIYIEDEEDY